MLAAATCDQASPEEAKMQTVLVLGCTPQPHSASALASLVHNICSSAARRAAANVADRQWALIFSFWLPGVEFGRGRVAIALAQAAQGYPAIKVSSAPAFR